MHHDRYEAITDVEHEIFEFLSAGPKGSIKKVVRYKLIAGPVYNLGFGDWNEEAQTARDDVRTNNDDRDKVLATVVFTLIDFMQFHPTAIVFAKGSPPPARDFIRWVFMPIGMRFVYCWRCRDLGKTDGNLSASTRVTKPLW